MNYIDKRFQEWRETATADGEKAAFKAGYNAVSKWVYADIKQPDKGVRVLTYSELGVHICHIDANGAWRISYETQQMTVPVTHWMYLPTIPKARPQEDVIRTEAPFIQDNAPKKDAKSSKKNPKTNQNEPE